MRDTGQTSAQTTSQRGSSTDQKRHNREKQRVGIVGVLVGAARTGQRHWHRIVPVAIAVSALTTLAELGVDELVPQDSLPWSLIAGLTASGLSLLGAVFLSGFLTKLVGGSRENDSNGRPDDGPSIKQVLRTLPWGRLIGADVLVALLVVLGLFLLVIPGLVMFNLLALVGPVIEVENLKIIAAIRRSIHLVRGHFWSVALLATLPVVVAGEIETLAPDPDSLGQFLKVLAIRGLAEGLVEAVVGLILVQLTFRLRALDGAASQPAEKTG